MYNPEPASIKFLMMMATNLTAFQKMELKVKFKDRTMLRIRDQDSNIILVWLQKMGLCIYCYDYCTYPKF